MHACGQATLVAELATARQLVGLATSARRQGAALALIDFVGDVLGEMRVNLTFSLTALNVTMRLDVEQLLTLDLQGLLPSLS